jgi:CRP/FNR family transcriptional regulator, cyclic AMP receptor protein
MGNAVQNQNDRLDQFKSKIHNLIHKEPRQSRAIKVASGAVVYVSGDRDAKIYSIESGQVKHVFSTPEGREYVLAIRTAGDIFGELCLSGVLTRTETVIAMRDTCLYAISYSDLLRLVRAESLLEDLIGYLACCNAAQLEIIGSLLTENSERRLARLLLQLGSLRPMAVSPPMITMSRILHEDLAAMVGTTRSRVGFFLKRFQELGFIKVNTDRSLTIKADKLKEFTQQNTFTENAKAAIDRNEPARPLASFK